jgi:hypothetical protein
VVTTGAATVVVGAATVVAGAGTVVVGAGGAVVALMRGRVVGVGWALASTSIRAPWGNTCRSTSSTAALAT